MNNIINGQSAAKFLNDISQEKGSTTIPKGSTGEIWEKVTIFKMKNVIYKITNIINNKFYIGSATWYSKRKDKHLWTLKKSIHANRYLQNAWNKYGEENFIFEIIEQCNESNLIEREQYWLDFYNCYNRNVGYNIQPNASSPKGCKRTNEFKEKIGNFWRGKKFSKKRIEELIERTTKKQGKAVNMYDKEMNFIKEFKSISEASREIKISIGAISKQCSKILKGRFKKSRAKFIFKYKDIV